MSNSNASIYKHCHMQNPNMLKYPSEYLIRAYHAYIKNGIPPRGKVLDFGYGSGNNSVFFLEKGYDVYGTEISDAAISKIKNNLDEKGLDPSLSEKFATIEHNAKKLPFENEMFDCVLSTLVLEFSPTEDRIRELSQEFMRCLKPGGIVLFSMCGIRSSIFSDAVPTQTKNVYKVAGKGSRSMLDGQYIYIVPDAACLTDLFSIFETVSTGYIEEDLFGRRDFNWIYIGRKTAKNL